MALRKHPPCGPPGSVIVKPLGLSTKVSRNTQPHDPDVIQVVEPDVEIDLREVYFLILHFLSAGPCQQAFAQLRNELLEHQLLPRRYHAWLSRSVLQSQDEDSDRISFPLSYTKLLQRYPHIKNDHLVKLLRELIVSQASALQRIGGGRIPNAADVPTLLGMGSFSLLSYDRQRGKNGDKPPLHMRWPHRHADQVRGLTLREIGGGFAKHHRAPSVRAACYAIAQPSTMVQKMQNIKRLRGHRNAVYCAILDRSGRYVITGSDDRLVKIWSMDTAYCLASCRGHEGDITDLAVSSNNTFIASSSNDCIIRVWRLPDGLPVSVLRGHTGAVTAIAFSPRPGSPYQLLSSSDDGTCRIWDARGSQFSPRIYSPRPLDPGNGRSNGSSSSNVQQIHQIFCCAFNSNGTVFVTGSSDTLARVWNACKSNTDDSDHSNHEIDVLAGHENDVNYVQFSGCAVGSRFSVVDSSKEENVPKFKNTWFCHDNIVTCSRDGSAIIWIPRSRRSRGKNCRWTKAYHLKVPAPPIPPQPPRGGGPRQRILPTPRGVNMIVWSLDNRFVLAAIMDCRICVWNASDGSLVHSLTGHTGSTYVLDVHPFNPRIAMSAGYDGKTIVWDIWKGMPIQIYEISRFKLVDGKFSPDGTSIILSDDVGQLYILSTGQGDSQKDAKYDQFYLGDYRPLIQDTYGHVLDQETQLVPYRRNMEDLLCDSGMIPYPEPYQTMFQQRRLGALGKEWRPSSLRLAVGPDITLDQDYQMPPLADLDLVIDPLPEFVDTMDWEPEYEILSDDTDSEYNAAEECSSGGEQKTPSFSSSSESECSAKESMEDQDVHRRSKRKKSKADIEVMTSSGRRVKRRNLDDYAGPSTSNARPRRLKNGQKEVKRKSSKSKPSRPRRAAARNALSWFSKISGTSKETEDAETSTVEDSSDSELLMQDSDLEVGEFGGYILSEHGKQLKGKEVLVMDPDVGQHSDTPESQSALNRRRLVLKLPMRDPYKLIKPEETNPVGVQQSELAGSSGNNPGAITGNESISGSPIPLLLNKFDKHNDISDGCIDCKIKWGAVRARTSKRLRIGDPAILSQAYSGFGICPVFENENKLTGELKILDNEWSFNSLENGVLNASMEPEHLPMKGTGVHDDDSTPSIYSQNGAILLPELKESLPPLSVKSKQRSKRVARDHDHSIPDELGCSGLNANPDLTTDLVKDADNDNIDLANEVSFVSKLDAHNTEDLSYVFPVSLSSQSQAKKRFDVVYRRKKCKSTPEGNSCFTQDSHAYSWSHDNCGVDYSETSNRIGRAQTDSSVPIVIKHRGSENNRSVTNGENHLDECHNVEWEADPRLSVGLRSTRNRRASRYLRDDGSVERKKFHQSSGKGSWLMLTAHEGSRYIPQKGDEIVYLRQGHQEYLEFCGRRDIGPWSSIRGIIGAVEVCKVERLEYSTLSGSGDSCCKMILRFIDPASIVFNKSFKLTLPEVVSFPDFLVEKSRFDAALHRNWTCRDKCKVWWKNEGEEDGSWWEGRILSVKPKSPQFPDSPWERYQVKYKSDPTETHLHSPWELFDADTQWEPPHVDYDIRMKLLYALAKLDKSAEKVQDTYGVQKLKQAMQKSSYNNRFPVPLSLDVIQCRVENNYYRSLEAFEHDISVMLVNAESYFMRNAELTAKIKRLSQWLARTLSSL